MQPPQRLVLDTNVWLDLLLFGDARCLPLQAALDQATAIALTDHPCRAEWHRVLGYPALRLADGEAERLRDRYDVLAVRVDAPTRPQPWPPLPRCKDADDQKFLELACAAHASVLLTRDDALLALGRRTLRAGLFRICSPEGYDPTELDSPTAASPTDRSWRC